MGYFVHPINGIDHLATSTPIGVDLVHAELQLEDYWVRLGSERLLLPAAAFVQRLPASLLSGGGGCDPKAWHMLVVGAHFAFVLVVV